jgi:hypothetical protein
MWGFLLPYGILSRARVELATHSLKGEPGRSVHVGRFRSISFGVATYFVRRLSISFGLGAFRTPSW